MNEHFFIVLTLAATAAALSPGAAPTTDGLLQKLPLRFEERQDQVFLTRGSNYELTLTRTASRLAVRNPVGGRISRMEMQLAGANRNARGEALDRLPAFANYFLGSEQNWRANVPAYGRVRYRSVYPGVDLVFRGDEGRLEYDFVLAPFSDPRSIRWKVSGNTRMRVDENGDLRISTESGDVRWKRPEVYQETDRGRKP